MELAEEDDEFRRPEVPMFTSTPRAGHGRPGGGSGGGGQHSGRDGYFEGAAGLGDHILCDEGGHEPAVHEGESDGDIVDGAELGDHLLGDGGGHEPPGHEGDSDGDNIGGATELEEDNSGNTESEYLKEEKCLLCGMLFAEQQAGWKSSQHNTDSLLTVYG